MNWTDINTYGSLASLLGIIISLIAFLAANSARKAVKKVQDSILFDKRIPTHLRSLDELLSQYNELLNDIEGNNSSIKKLHALLKSELSSLLDKTDNRKARNLIKKTIKKINKKTNRSFFKESNSHSIRDKLAVFLKRTYLTSHSDLWEIYNYSNEIHRYLNNLQQDRKYLIKC